MKSFEYKICSKCKQEKPVSEFRKAKRYKDGIFSWCRKCTNKWESEHRKGKGRTGWLKTKRKHNITKYGISVEEYKNLLTKQKFACAICKQQKYSLEEWESFISGKELDGKSNLRLSIDHCHKTNKVRGLLCSECNNGIGKLKDSPKFLIAAAQYITQNS